MDEDPTILVVDDSTGCCALYAEWLCGQYEVRTAPDKDTAVDNADVDLVLLDRDMGEDDGRDVARELTEQGSDIHIVMVSWLEADFDIVESPLDGYVEKPVTEDNLVEIVEQYERLQDYQRSLGEYFSLSSKLAAIEAKQSEDQLAANAEYDHLKARVEQKQQEVDKAIAEGTADWNIAFKTCADPPKREAIGNGSE